MSHQLAIAMRFRRHRKWGPFRRKTASSRPRQGEPFQVELEIKNVGNATFPKTSLGALTLGCNGTKQDLRFEGPIPEIAVGGSTLLSTEVGITYHADRCTFETSILPSDRQGLEMTLQEPVKAVPPTVGGHLLFMSCFIESELLVNQRRLGRLSLFFALVALGAAAAALTLGRSPDDGGHDKDLAQVEAKLDAIEANTSWLRAIAGRFDNKPAQATKVQTRRSHK
jgi:hypothetical protein